MLTKNTLSMRIGDLWATLSDKDAGVWHLETCLQKMVERPYVRLCTCINNRFNADEFGRTFLKCQVDSRMGCHLSPFPFTFVWWLIWLVDIYQSWCSQVMISAREHCWRSDWLGLICRVDYVSGCLDFSSSKFHSVCGVFSLLSELLWKQMKFPVAVRTFGSSQLVFDTRWRRAAHPSWTRKVSVCW